MTIAFADGVSHENELDMLLAKDMPSREETNRQQKLKGFDDAMPPDMRGPPTGDESYPSYGDEDNQLHPQNPKDQNDPYTWGMGPSMDRTGPAMVPYPTPKFQHIMGALDEIISPQQIQAGPNNKDITPAQDNRPDLYIDENGAQRSRKNDEILSPHSSFVDKMAKGLSSSDAQLLEKYYQGYESTHGKWTDEDQKRLQPFQDAVQSEIGHLPGHTSTFAPNGQETIEMHNWDSLLMDKVLKQYKMLNPGRRSEDDSLPQNAKPAQQTLSYDEYKKLNPDTGDQKPDQLLEAVKIVKDWAGEKASEYSPFISRLADMVERQAPAPVENKETASKEPNAFSKPTKEDQTEAYIKNLKPSGLGETYDNFNAGLIRLADKLQPDFVPTAEQFKNASWKEQIGWMLGTTMMLAGPERGKTPTGEVMPSPRALDFWKEGLGAYDKVNHPVIATLKTAEKAGSEVAGRLLETYNKIDDPMVKMEFGRMVSNRLSQASRMAEEGVPGGAKFENPEIRLTDDQMKTIKEGFAAGKNNKEIAKDAGIGYSQLQNTLVTKTEQAAELRAAREAAPDRAQRKWSDNEKAALKDWYENPDTDMFQVPDAIKHRSDTAILQQAKTMGLEEVKSRTGVSRNPKDPTTYAPEKGSGSGGDEPPRLKTILRTNKPINTPIKEPVSAPANENKGQKEGELRIRKVEVFDENKNLIDTPEQDAAIEKISKNLVAAGSKDIPLISPPIEKRLQAINPSAFKKLKQFETEMDYKHKSENRNWLSDLSDADIKRYQKLYEQAQKEPPRDIKDIRFGIRRMLNPPEPDK